MVIRSQDQEPRTYWKAPGTGGPVKPSLVPFPSIVRLGVPSLLKIPSFYRLILL